MQYTMENYTNALYAYEVQQDVLNIVLSDQELQKIISNMKHNPSNDHSDVKYQIINADVSKLDNLWRHSFPPDLYLSPIYDELRQPLKYYNSRCDLLNHKVVTSPIISYDYDDATLLINFVNGRHRFANIRDLGGKVIPILVNKNHIYFLKEIFAD